MTPPMQTRAISAAAFACVRAAAVEVTADEVSDVAAIRPFPAGLTTGF